MKGTLYIVSTPIGNTEDITIRALHTLFEVEAIVCEDTRRTGNLLHHIFPQYKKLYDKEVKRPQLIAMNNFNEHTVSPSISTLLRAGKSIALVSDGGTPLVSDPGYLLVRECIDTGINIVPVPGSSAFLTALVASGLPAYPFCFLGYPPEKPGKRLAFFRNLNISNSAKENIIKTVILYASPHKIIRILEDLEFVFGDIQIVVGRELTKLYEEISRTSIQKTLETFKKIPPKGELVILFSPKTSVAN